MADPWAEFREQDPWAAFRQPEQTPPEQPGVVGDSVASLGSGVVRGTVETAMLPVTAGRLLQDGTGYLFEKGDDLVRHIFGLPPADPARRAQARAYLQDNPVNRTLFGAQDAVRGVMNDTLYEPRTTAGKYAETVGEFLAPGAVPSKATRLAPGLARKAGEYAADLTRNALLPGGLSEAAGQATEGSAAEPYARIAGAMVGTMGGALAKSYAAPETVLRRAVGDPAQVDWERAAALQNNPTGIRLTGPEAITQAQGGASGLPNVQRVVEGSVEGRALTAPFFAQRPQQVDAAVSTVLDRIAPQSSAPSSLGPQLARAAEKAIDASPEGQALLDAIFGAGPRTTPVQAGEVIQPALRNIFEKREGMRNALADADYAAARQAPARTPVSDLVPEQTTVQPAYTSIKPDDAAAAMVPEAVPAKTEPLALTSRTGPNAIQADPRSVVQFIDELMPDARAASQDALKTVRSAFYQGGGLDTSVNGLDAVRGQIGDMITAAKQGGQMQTADLLGQIQRKLDDALTAVPEYAKARENFQQASKPLEPFTSPGMQKVVAKDEFNRNFTLPPEDVTAALSSPSEAKNFVSVASPDAKAAAGNQLATNLIDRATDQSGRVSGERLSALLRDSQDLLTAYPEVAARLQKVVDASAGMEAARSGPLGEVAAAKNTTAAGNVLLPQNPMVGSEDEIAAAVRRLLEQDADATKGTVRQALADRYSKAAVETQEGSREFAGAKFHKDIAGNPQREVTLEEILAAVADDKGASMRDLRDVLQATGRRKAIGSATEFNRSLNADLGSASLTGRVVNTARTLGASFLTNAGDSVKRAAMRNNLGELADLFTDPNSVDLIRAAIARGPATNVPEAAARSGMQAQIASEKPDRKKRAASEKDRGR